MMHPLHNFGMAQRLVYGQHDIPGRFAAAIEDDLHIVGRGKALVARLVAVD